MSASRRFVEVGGGWGGWGRLLLAVSAVCTATTCTTSKTSANLHQPPGRYDPTDLGALFQDVQLSGIFADSKTFVDARPLVAPSEIVARYTASTGMKVGRGLLRGFVAPNLQGAPPGGEGFPADTSPDL